MGVLLSVLADPLRIYRTAPSLGCLALWAQYWLRAAAGHVRASSSRRFGFLLGANRPPVAGSTFVSAKWLTGVLRSKGAIAANDEVAAVSPEDLHGNRGLGSAMTRLRLTYADRGSPSAGPATLILKTSQCSVLRNRFTAIATGAAREGLFYGSAWASELSQYIPRVHYSRGSLLTGDSVTVMEDFGGHALPVNMVFGNQCWGIPDGTPVRDPKTVLVTAVECAARLHASMWNDPSLVRRGGGRGRFELRSALWYRGEGRASWEMGMQYARNSWSRVRNNTAAGGVVWSDKMLSVMDKSLARASWDALQRRLQDRSIPFTLTHGDWHAANMLWRLAGEGEGSAAEGIVVVDWTEIGVWEPMADIGQMFISDINPTFTRKVEQDVLDAYWERLQSECERRGIHGVREAFPRAQCEELFCTSPVERWLWLLALLAAMQLPPAAVQYFHDRVLAFIEAHGDREWYEMKPICTFAPSTLSGLWHSSSTL